MATNVLVAYASKHGTTREVAESIAATLQQLGLDVEIEEAGRVRDIARYDALVVGGGLYTGKWHADARHLLKRHRHELAERRLAVFGMGPDSMDESKVAESRKQLDRALSATPELEPIAVTIFGGALKPESLRFPFNRLPAFDARDWDAIRSWATDVAAKLTPVAV
ncbi:MAG TPA: flavodoxin domain-containing protein [Gaiellaceae bacterium]